MSEPIVLDKFIEACFVDAWRLFIKDPVLYILAGLLVALISAVSLGICAGPMVVGFLELARRRQLGETVEVSEIFNGFQRFWPAALTAFLIGLAAFIGWWLLFLPGLVVAWLTMFALVSVATENTGSVNAIQRSVSLTLGQIPVTLVLFLALAIATAIGTAVVIGFLVTIPLNILVASAAFERLTVHAKQVISPPVS